MTGKDVRDQYLHRLGEVDGRPMVPRAPFTSGLKFGTSAVPGSKKAHKSMSRQVARVDDVPSMPGAISTVEEEKRVQERVAIGAHVV
jgi:hypothetical protein